MINTTTFMVHGLNCMVFAGISTKVISFLVAESGCMGIWVPVYTGKREYPTKESIAKWRDGQTIAPGREFGLAEEKNPEVAVILPPWRRQNKLLERFPPPGGG